MMKRILSLILSFVLICSFSCCGVTVKEFTEEKIAELETMSSSQLAANNGEADVILQKNAEALNNVITEFNTVLAEIAETENYEIIYNKRLLEKYRKSSSPSPSLLFQYYSTILKPRQQFKQIPTK